jgi:hypothetical protein
MDLNLSARLTPNHQIRSKSQNQREKIDTKEKHLEVPKIQINSNLLAEKESNANENIFTEDTEMQLSSAQYQDSDSSFLPGLGQKLKVETTFKFEKDAFIKDTSLRYNPWSKTILGFNFFVNNYK